ncbi:MAG: M28 family metallopeptidase [bacterium]
MKRVFLSGLLLCASCGPQQVPPAPSSYDPSALTGESAFREVEQFVALGSKVPGTEGARRAATALINRLTSLGVTAERDEFRDVTPRGTGIFVNVTATLPGAKPGLIILAAHWDTKSGIEGNGTYLSPAFEVPAAGVPASAGLSGSQPPEGGTPTVAHPEQSLSKRHSGVEGFVGANDSGSGVGVLLALAPILKSGTNERPSVMLAFLDGEECQVNYGPNDGLHGSRHLVAGLVASGRARAVRAMILLDMIGDRDLNVAIPRNGTPELISAVFKAAEANGTREKFSLSRQGVLDDHQPFLDVGMPAVDLIDFDYGSVPGANDYWHTPADTVDKLSPASLETVGRVVLRMLNGLY